MNALDARKSIQRILGVTDDGAIGKMSRTAFDALASAHPDWTWPPVAVTADPVVPMTGEVDPRSAGNIATLLPVVRELAVQLLQKLRTAGIDAKVISGTRTYAEQDALYAQGRTTSGNIVTNARGGYSWHNHQVAFDIGIFKDGKYLDDSPLYTKAGAIGQALGLEWGGAWTGKLVDEPHFQLTHGKTLADARTLHEEGKSVLT